MKRLFVFTILSLMLIGMSLSGTPVSANDTGKLAWNTFLGGNAVDFGLGVALDRSGNIYVSGYSNASWGAPIRPWTQGYDQYPNRNDAFVAKLDPNGALVWNTFLGGGGTDVAKGIGLDASGNIYVLGHSDASWGVPRHAFTDDWDVYVAKLDGNGVLQWNTFLGGARGDTAEGLAVDGKGRVVVTGHSDASWGTPKRASHGNDAFVAKLNPKGDLIWNTFLGGNGYERGFGIAVDANSVVYVTGTSSESWGSPIRAFTGQNDGFVAKIGANGALKWNTFLGGTNFSEVIGVVVSSKGPLYVVGTSDTPWGKPKRSFTTDTPGTFVAKLSPGGALKWNTFLGGGGQESGAGIALDRNENLYVVGGSTETWGEPTRAFAGNLDGFVAMLDWTGALKWNTFLGGNELDRAFGIAVDGSANVYIAGHGEGTWGTPVRAFTDDRDAFVVKIQ